MKKSIIKLMFFFVAAIIVGGLFNDVFAALAGGSIIAFAAPAAGVDYDKAIKEAREQLATKQGEMRTLIETAEAETRDFNEDEQKQFDNLEKEAKSIEQRIARLEKAENMNASGAGKQKQKTEKEQKEERKQELEQAFRSYIRRGWNNMPAEHRQIIEERALSSTTDAEGGYTVPETFSGYLEKAMKEFGGIMSVAWLFPTTTGSSMNYPTTDDTNNEGEIIDENTDAGESVDPSYGNVRLNAFTYSSKPVLVPNQLLQDNEVNLDQVLAQMLSERIFRAFNKHATIGDGTTQPQGVTTGGALGKEAAMDAITYDDMVDLQHSVDAAYRDGAVWMFHDSTLKHLRKLKNTNDEPIFQENLRTGEPSTILGKPFVINNHMPEIGAGNKSVVFGNFQKYMIRQVRGASVKRLEELYAAKNQTGFLLFMRLDGKILDAGTKPLKYIQHATS